MKILVITGQVCSVSGQWLFLYSMLDDHSNRALAQSELFSVFNISGCPSSYSLKTCAGTMETKGRQARRFMVETADGSVTLSLPPLIECNKIPNTQKLDLG